MSKLFALVLYAFVHLSSSAEVTTSFGNIEGYEFQSAQGRNVFGFRGIPFALPPVGKLRYKYPEPILPWNGTFQAKEYRDDCIQKFADKIFGSEDCLYLNVYTPKLPSSGDDTKLPVLVFIHGGSFVIGGSSIYGVDKLMDQDIVVVTINYRLGPFGFLSTEDEVLPSNLGMWDQVEALRWVRNNVKNFGGDPNLVTLSGSSAGAASALYHMFAPASTGLFHRVIAHSGTPLCPWASQEKAVEFTAELAKELGCDVSTSKKILECMKDIPASDVIQTSSKFVFGEFYPILYAPVVEKKGTRRFLFDNVLTKIENGDIINKVPVMTGVTTDEGIIIYNRVARHNEINAEFYNKKLPELLKNNTNLAGELEEAARIVRNVYIGSMDLSNKETLVNATSELLGDIYFYSGNYLMLILLAQKGIPTYSYVFNYQNDFGFMDLLEPPRGGVSHVDDLFYIYEYNLVKYSLKEEDKVMSAKFIGKLVEFMKEGSVAEWPKFTPELPAFLHIHNEKMEVDVGYRAEQADVWNSILPELINIKIMEREEL